jgi:superfamily II DNA helicase RecQ
MWQWSSMAFDVQREAVQAIERESPIVVILPMAGGKSACICTSARPNEYDKKTIVVVPPEELARDIVKGSQGHKIPTIHWQENCQNRGRHSRCA